MPSLITGLTGTTELEAVNTCLAAIGQAPVATIDTSLTDVEMAVAKLKETARELQSQPWRFNTRFQMPISPASGGPFAWTDPDGTARSLNIFVPPANLGSFTPSRTMLMFKQGYDLDLAVMPSVSYASGGTPVFFDRRFNRDGLIASDFPKLYIDAQLLFDFDDLPETARRYIAASAARRFVVSVLGEQALTKDAQDAEVGALRILKRAEGMEDSPNMLNHPDVSRVLGFRERITGSFQDLRRGTW